LENSGRKPVAVRAGDAVYKKIKLKIFMMQNLQAGAV
jgi:hypothetical protein